MSSQKETVLAMLTEAGEAGVTSNAFFAAYLPRFSARIHELKAEGYRIEKEPIDAGFWLYRPSDLQRPINPPQGIAADQPTGELSPAPVGHASVSGGQGFSCDGDSPGGPTSGSSYYDWEEAA